MKRRLNEQMCHQWRGNTLLILELIISGSVTGIILCLFINLASLRMTDMGYDLENIYVANIKFVSPDSEKYVPYDSLHSYYTDLELLRQHMADNPMVENVGIGNNALPYNYNYLMGMLSLTDGDSVVTYQGNTRTMTPETVEAIRLTGTRGESPAQLAEMLRQGQLIISEADRSIYDPVPDPYRFIGREVILDNDSAALYRIGAVIRGIRRSDYEYVYNGVIIKPAGKKDIEQMIIRVRPGMGRKFSESVRAEDLEQGNVYLSDITPIELLRDNMQIDFDTLQRDMTTIALFLLAIIFMGFLGTFWLRTHERVSEIAIRLVNGATKADIFRRLLSEGLILLAIAMIPIIIIDLMIVLYVVPEMELWEFFWIGMAATAALNSLIILAGIWIPARKAIKINPSQALRDQ